MTAARLLALLTRSTRAAADPASAPPRRLSLRLSLLFVVLLCAVPALVVSASLALANHQLKRQAVYNETEILARRIAAELDRELSVIESGLNVLATSEALRSGDLERFHRVALDALQTQVVYNYVLTDASGRQVLNTLKPWGTPLPKAGTPAQLDQVFTQGRTALSDWFLGPVTGRPALAMGVPVYRDGQVRYSLNVGLAPERISQMLRRQPLPPGWLVAVLDASGTIVGRSRDADRFAGQKAVPPLLQVVRTQDHGSLETVTKDGQAVVSTYLRSPAWHWSVVIGAPKDIVEAQLARLLGWLLVALCLSALGLWLAVRQANRVLSSVQQLNDAALALGGGVPVSLPAVQLSEAQAVGQAIVQAAQLMADVRHRANHDALTGLANRALFKELLQHQLAGVLRDGQPLAVLAVDLDHFKQVNDEQGHAKGDELLVTVAARIQTSLRACDVAARTGGDEFLVLLTQADERAAREIAQRLLAALREPYAGVHAAVSASIGIAVYPGAGLTLQALLESADRALYAAKHAGRDGCQLAGRE